MDKVFQTPTTPNVLNILTLGFVAAAFADKFGNISDLYKLTQSKQKALVTGIDEISGMNVVSNSETVIVLESTEECIIKIKEVLSKNGFVIGSCYGANKTKQVRISNFPVHTSADHGELLKILKMI